MTNEVTFQTLETMADAANTVTVLGGYSGAGYDLESLTKLEHRVREIVRTNGDESMYVIGATPDGIGKSYDWIRDEADKNGFSQVVTAGIVSEAGKEYGAAENCDNVNYVSDPEGTWQVNDENGDSLMIKIAADRPAKSTVAYFGGGKVSLAELTQASKAQGLKVLVASNEEFKPAKPEKLAEPYVTQWMAANAGKFSAATTNGTLALAKENLNNDLTHKDLPKVSQTIPKA
jgi:hypothetical protein